MTDRLTRAQLARAIQGARINTRVESTMLDLADTLALRMHDLTTPAGAGITAAVGGFYKSSVMQRGSIIQTDIYVDLTGLSSGAAGDIIGVNGAANCHLGRITVADCGVLQMGSMTCLEAPAGGDTDIDLYSAVESTGVEDAAITGLVETALVTAGAAWTNGAVKGLTALPAANEYLYLADGGAGVSAAYTAGKFLITLIGSA